jgi:hypothetical protein
VVGVEHELAVGGLAGVGPGAELGGLPGLTLVLAEVLNDEGADVGDREQALAGSVDGEAAEVGGDPVATELLGDGGGGAGAAEAIEDEVAFVTARINNPSQQGFRLLCRITQCKRSAPRLMARPRAC